MARLAVTAIFALLFVNQLALASYSPSPSPAPEVGADSSPSQNPSPPIESPADSPLAPSPPPPVAPSPSDPVPEKSPESSPAPSPTDVTQINHSNLNAAGEEAASDGEGGMSRSDKAGVAVGVIFAAAVVGAAGLVYKKRQDNIRRSQYSSAARREFL